MDCFEDIEIVPSSLPALIGLDAELRLASTSLATATLVVLLLCATREGLAQTGAAGGGSAGQVTAVLASASIPTADALPLVVDPPKIQRLRELDALLAVRGGLATPISARQTDEAIAAAVARGTAKDLAKPKAFRKKSNDLFRTQRDVQILDQEMQVRLRLRAKTRNAMSVELRF